MLFDINNQQIMNVTQAEPDGPVRVAVCYEDKIEKEFAVSAGDFVTMLNWYRYQKDHGNENLMF